LRIPVGRTGAAAVSPTATRGKPPELTVTLVEAAVVVNVRH
jgi:hypothetical protein